MSEARPYIYKEDEVTPTENQRRTITHVLLRNAIITAEAFQHCDRLVEVIFTPGLQIIYSSAFERCSALEQISFPSTLQTIGKWSFRQCINLTELTFPDDGMLVEIDMKAFEGCQSLCAISFPQATTSTCNVGYQAFAKCSSLLGVEIPSNASLKFGRNVFQGCHALVNVSIPMTMVKSGVDRGFVTCECLQKCYPACDFPEALVDRYFKLPLHNLCYHASTTKLPDLVALMASYEKYDSVDRWGMTAYHVLVTSAKLRPDLILALMDRYRMDVILKKDRNDKTVLDYLIAHKSYAATVVFQKVLKRMLTIGMEWGIEEWRLDVWSVVESYGRQNGRIANLAERGDANEGPNMAGEERIRIRRQSFDELTRRLARYGRKEVTSVLEQVLWKMKIKAFIDMSRVDCRLSCGSEFVIPHVMDHLWHSCEPSDGLLYLNL